MSRTQDGSAARIDRRTMLKGVGIAGLGPVGTVASAGSVTASRHCDTVVDGDGSGDYDSIQEAVDDASSGETICVRPGRYEEDVTIDESVTVDGQFDPGSSYAAVVEGTVEVTADGATVSSLRVVPSETFVPGGIDPVGVLVTGDDVAVSGNVVAGVTGDTTDNGSMTLNAIQVWSADESDPLTGAVVENNVVRHVDNRGGSSWPDYGGAAAIKVQGAVDGVDVVENDVRDVRSAGWAWGIVTTVTANAPGVSPRSVTVAENTVSDVNDGTVYDVFDEPGSAPYPGVNLGIDGDADAGEVTVERNNLGGSPLGVQNKDEDDELAVECNYWGRVTGPAAHGNPRGGGSGVLGPGDVNYVPWSRHPTGIAGSPGGDCNGRPNRGGGRGRGRGGGRGRGRGGER